MYFFVCVCLWYVFFLYARLCVHVYVCIVEPASSVYVTPPDISIVGMILRTRRLSELLTHHNSTANNRLCVFICILSYCLRVCVFCMCRFVFFCVFVFRMCMSVCFCVSLFAIFFFMFIFFRYVYPCVCVCLWYVFFCMHVCVYMCTCVS